MNSKDKNVKAVGYIRVSTAKQAADDENFEKQAKKIRNACERRGFNLVTICEDLASGADPLGAVRREGLVDAVSRARAEGAILVIPEPTRLFRNLEAARNFLTSLDIRVFSVRDARFMKAPALLRAIERGEASVHAIREGTATAMSRKQAAGTTFAEDTVRSLAAKKSAEVRTQRSVNITMQIAQILKSDTAYRDLSHRALADLLNRRRLLTGWRRQWTQNSVRDARRKAMELIEMMEEVDNSGDVVQLDIEAGAQQLLAEETSSVESDHAAQAEHNSQENDPVDPDSRATEDEDWETGKLPYFGMF